MKRKLLYATLFVFVHYIIGISADILLGYDIYLPDTVLGITYLCLWTWLSYSLYNATESIQRHTIYVCLPMLILFLAYIPLVRVLIINIALIYVAPVFVIATSIAASFNLPITVWTVVSISIALMVICAYLGASAKKSINIEEKSESF